MRHQASLYHHQNSSTFHPHLRQWWWEGNIQAKKKNSLHLCVSHDQLKLAAPSSNITKVPVTAWRTEKTPQGRLRATVTRFKSIRGSGISHLKRAACVVKLGRHEGAFWIICRTKTYQLAAPLSMSEKHTVHHNVFKQVRAVHLSFDVYTLMYSHVSSVL